MCFAGVEDIELTSGEELSQVGVYLITLNGRILGLHRSPSSFARNFRLLRRAGERA